MIPKYQIFLNKNLHDINPILAGEGGMNPGQFSAPVRYTYTLIHKVLEGNGKIIIGDHTYPVRAGQCFILHPGECARWGPDEENSWTYQWIGFNGALAESFSQVPTVFDAPDGILPHIHNCREADDNISYLLAGDLLQLYGILIKPQHRKKDHVQAIIDYIHFNYMTEITIGGIAESVGLNADYLSRLFKKKTGLSLQDYIVRVRFREARRYLKMGYSVKETATLCGFKDVSNFSKLFKRLDGLSPTQWRHASGNLTKDGNRAEEPPVPADNRKIDA